MPPRRFRPELNQPAENQNRNLTAIAASIDDLIDEVAESSGPRTIAWVYAEVINGAVNQYSVGGCRISSVTSSAVVIDLDSPSSIYWVHVSDQRQGSRDHWYVTLRDSGQFLLRAASNTDTLRTMDVGTYEFAVEVRSV